MENDSSSHNPQSSIIPTNNYERNDDVPEIQTIIPETNETLLGQSSVPQVYYMQKITNQAYASKAGFDVRISTTTRTKGAISHRYMVCSKSGIPCFKDVDTINTSSSSTKRRHRNIKVSGCTACIRLKVPSTSVGFEIYNFIEGHNHDLVSDYNMDLTRGRRQLQFSEKKFIQSLQTAGFGPTVAHRVQSSLKGGQHLVTGTKSDFKNHARNVRSCVADAVAQMIIDRCNYTMFGEVLAFDATYATNSSWQAAQLKGEMQVNEEIRCRVNKLVWNVFIKPETFESRWHALIDEFNLSENKWFKDMFAIRESWVSAYFIELPMCCLMKTTSRCESSHSQFKVYSSRGNNPVQFMNCFEMALQRHVQRQLQNDMTTKTPPLETPLPTERHASYVYTIAIFKEVQKEITRGLHHCAHTRLESEDGLNIHFINHKDKRNGFVGEFKDHVIHSLNDNTFSCSCKSFTRIGYLCRHVFKVFQIELIDEIPEKYIPTRWMSDALPSSLFKIESRYGVPLDDRSKLREQFLTLTNQCADRAQGNTELLQSLVDQMQQMKNKIWEKIPSEPSNNNNSAIIQDLIGYKI
ncbi:protein FAR1-RELATED SEQUENCE 5-like [Bidens hawaiensis]|uniref:protein FAR1-RELATED SEQUENCE 5-like n=1 Tax=Bidens hawaiensis TaxID=980011 RepID=UPI00404B6824